MTIEIRELVIRATVLPTADGQHTGLAPQQLDQLKKQIIAECRERVLEQLSITERR